MTYAAHSDYRFRSHLLGAGRISATTAAGLHLPGEIIEFGCALLDKRGRAIERTWQQYVRPQCHPQLTDFCTELTGIKQAQVAAAPLFPQALEAFRDTFGIRGGNEPRFASWGNYDRNILADDCRKHALDYPFRRRNHVNLKAEAVGALGLEKRMGVSRTLKAIGLEFEGQPHSGVDDAWNTGRIVLEMLKRGWKPPVPA